MFLGKEIRLKRLLNKNLVACLLLPWIILLLVVYCGIGQINTVMEQVVAGQPDAITMHKGIIEKYSLHMLHQIFQ